MAAKPNLRGLLRLAYLLVGAGLMGWGWFASEGWTRMLLPVLGAVILTEGMIGYCLICAALGLGAHDD